MDCILPDSPHEALTQLRDLAWRSQGAWENELDSSSRPGMAGLGTISADIRSQALSTQVSALRCVLTQTLGLSVSV